MIQEERDRLDERWQEEWLVRHWKRERRLHRVLRHKIMMPQQFVGMTLTLGAALSRNTLRGNQDLSAIIQTGETTVQECLTTDIRNFSTLKQDQMHNVLQRAGWLTRIDRAHRLQMVPPENLDIIRKNLTALEEVFPTEFTTNPFDAIADLLEEQGLPFEELTGSVTDTQIEWSRDEAIIGHEIPDPEFTARSPGAKDPQLFHNGP